MKIKNYTSEMPVFTSTQRIEKVLIEFGARNIMKMYDNQVLIGIAFEYKIKERFLYFKLPAKIGHCEKFLWRQYARPALANAKKVRDQAERTAWKIVLDWVELQTTLIQLDQIEFLEAFLPYTYNPHTEKTYFETLKESDFNNLLLE